MKERTLSDGVWAVMPRANPAPDEALALDRLSVLDERDHQAMCSGGGTHNHSDYLHTLTWVDADATLQLEQSLLDTMASDPRLAVDFESVCLDAEDPEDDEPLVELYGLELGVAGAVVTLNAAQVVTVASCRGHGPADAQHRSTHPWLSFGTDRPRVVLVAEAAGHAGCSLFEDDETSDLYVSAPSLAEIIAFADEVRAKREAFDALPSTRWKQECTQ